MADFNNALMVVLKHEGGLVDNPDDPGGITNKGISLNLLKQIQPNATANDIRNLTIETAAKIYKTQFWDKNHYGQIDNQALATQLFDLCVNIGPTMANACMQRAINYANRAKLDDDGILGSKTLACINQISSVLLLQSALRTQSVNYYKSLVAKNPELSIFLQGWINRVYSN